MSERCVTNFCVVFFLTAATLHARQLLIEWRFLNRAMESGFLTSAFFAELQLFFILSFLVGAVGLLIRWRFRLIISLLGLGGVFLGYVGWRLYTIRQLKVVSQDPFFTVHPEYFPPHSFGLVGARWWDFAVFYCCLILFIWDVTSLLKRSHRSH